MVNVFEIEGGGIGWSGESGGARGESGACVRYLSLLEARGLRSSQDGSSTENECEQGRTKHLVVEMEKGVLETDLP